VAIVLRVVMLGMRLGGFAGVMLRVRMMGVREVGVVAGVFVFAIVMMAGRLAVMFGGFLVMVGGVFVMFGGASCGHGRSPMTRSARKMRACPNSARA
jgi:hypothetical protein